MVSAEDACGLLLAEGAVPADDAACLLFPGPDQLDQLAQTEAMVGESRLLLLLNPQWRRPSDFARADRARADQLFFNRGYEVRARVCCHHRGGSCCVPLTPAQSLHRMHSMDRDASAHNSTSATLARAQAYTQQGVCATPPTSP